MTSMYPKGILYFFSDLEEVILKEKKSCEVCLYYELLPDEEQGELFDNCCYPNNYENFKKGTCENWVYYKDRTMLVRLLCELKKVALHDLQREKTKEAIKRFKKRKEEGSVSSGCNLIKELLRAITWDSGRGEPVDMYRYFHNLPRKKEG